MSSNSKSSSKSEIQAINFSSCDWQNLPDLIFGDIMVILGLNNFADFQRCIKVCQSWNVMISQMTKFKKNAIRKKAESLAAQIREEWTCRWRLEGFGLSEIVTAACMAHHGLLVSVEWSWPLSLIST